MIRLQRVGRRNDPVFRIVVTDKRNAPKSGKFLDIVGSYNPRESKPEINVDKVKDWIAKGARASGTVHNLLIDAKIISGKKINVLPKIKAKEEASEEKAEEVTEEKAEVEEKKPEEEPKKEEETPEEEEPKAEEKPAGQENDASV